jgi:hypothetical protein
MKFNNDNQFGNYFYVPYCNAPNDSDAYWCIMFNGTSVLLSVLVIFIIMHEGAFEN